MEYTLSVKQARLVIEKNCNIIVTDHAVRQYVYRKKVRAIKTVGGIRICESSLLRYIRPRLIS